MDRQESARGSPAPSITRHAPADSHRKREAGIEQRGGLRVFLLGRVLVYCEGLAQLLSDRHGIRVVGVSIAAGESPQEIAAAGAEVVLVESATARQEGIVPLILRECTSSHVIALGVREDEAEVLACAEAGVAGYVACDASTDELIEIVCSARSGEFACSPRIAAILVRHAAAVARENATSRIALLTPRERQIIKLIDRGSTNRQIATVLSIEIATVKNHVHHILEKLGVSRRAAAAAKMRNVTQEP